jgi:hypothetical protein
VLELSSISTVFKFVQKEKNIMKYLICGLILLSFAIFLSCSETKREVSKDQVIAMRTTATDFMKDLKSILIKQMQTGGVLQAVSVCSDTAQVLTNNFGVGRGIYIKRVSLKNRNPNNFPDEFEKRVLNQFELLHQNNELNNETEFVEIVSEGDYNYLRYLKPIIVQAECINCHGSQTEMMPEVRNLIAQNYPNDKAVGYKTGDLRGAVSIKQVIE